MYHNPAKLLPKAVMCEGLRITPRYMYIFIRANNCCRTSKHSEPYALFLGIQADGCGSPAA
jgi:hypothetical protein